MLPIKMKGGEPQSEAIDLLQGGRFIRAATTLIKASKWASVSCLCF
jgi:hypothetical protein